MSPPPRRLTWQEAWRLARYKAAHRDTVIGYFGFGAWQARFPTPRGETIITRRTFGKLMDELDELDSSGGGPDTG
jgi:hypothetical protein